MENQDTKYHPRERCQFRQRRGFMPPENRFHGNLTFMNPVYQAQFEQIQHRPLPVCKHVDSFSLYSLDIEESINQYFNAIG